MIYFHNDNNLHNPPKEFAGDKLRIYPETPKRIRSIIDTLENHNVDIATASQFSMEYIKNIHEKEYVEFIQSIPDNLEPTAPIVINKGGMILEDSSFSAKLGHYFFDPATPIMGGTFRAARSAVDVALSSSEALLKGKNWSMAICRPPGHHANANQGGGYCIFNNVSCAAQYIVDKGKDVTILDLDYHHGNGTQDIFFKSSKVQYISIHADPKSNYPFYWGFESEIGEGEGKEYTINYPVVNTTTDEQYDRVLEQALADVREYNADVILVSMGFDAYHKDPIAGMKLSQEYYYRIGDKLQQFEKIAVILEGGYNTNDIGNCFYNLYRGLSA